MVLRFFFFDDWGVTAIEYALIASLIAMVIVAALPGLGQKVLGLFNQVKDGLS